VAPDNNWIKTGSHVMIVRAQAKPMLAGYPHRARRGSAKRRAAALVDQK
jgi:hypothetical protein